MEPTIASHNKLHKPKGKMVKPILKKLSHSEKNSLDLDRPWEEQQGPGLGVYSSTHDLGSARTARDVSFAFDSTVLMSSKPRYQHGRSPSGNSHASVATTASGGASRPSGFVHPFQQTPRTQTPPMVFNTSLISLESNMAYANNTAAPSALRDYSPTITENEDDEYAHSLRNSLSQGHNRTSSHSQSAAGRPSLSSQRAPSFSDMNAPPQLRVNTRAAPSGQSGHSGHSGHSRRTHGTGGTALASSMSQSDLQLNTASTLDSPSSGGPAAPSSFSIHSGSNAPLSPLRSSFEAVSFPRLRSRSELYAVDRTEQIREARRKFEERERVKAEKHDREMNRKRERRDQKEAKGLEKQAAQSRKNSGVGSESSKRPSLSRKTTPTFAANLAEYDRTGGSGSGLGSGLGSGMAEKSQQFKSSNYDNMAGGVTPSLDPTIDGVAFQHAHRNSSAKRKTQGYWTGFVLWLRTRLFRLGRR